jgi:hypothetical protein
VEDFCYICGREFSDKLPRSKNRSPGCSSLIDPLLVSSVDTCQECSLTVGDKSDSRWTRIASIKRQYGLSVDEYESLHRSQDKACAICGMHIALYANHIGIEVASVDHDHETGEVRGLLCRRCNTGIGCLGDSVETLISAQEYLQKYKNG